jgi:hypothetical protein
MTDDHGGVILAGVFAAFFLWRFWSAKEYGWIRTGRGWFARTVYRREEPVGFAMSQAFNLLLGLAFGSGAVYLAIRSREFQNVYDQWRPHIESLIKLH